MLQPYLSLEAELHDAFWDAEDGSSEVALLDAFLKKFPGRALEVGAGSGRLLVPLLELGHEVEGLELSEDMLALGKARAATAECQPVLHRGDMSRWDGGVKYASLLAPAFTFQLAADPVATLRHWHSLLENHGGLYLTVFMPYAELLGDLPENEWYEDHRVTMPDGRIGLLETRHQLDHAQQILTRDHRYSLTGKELQEHSSQQMIRWFEHPQLLAMLAECGFRTERFFVDFDPEQMIADPEEIDFDGILTYHATRISNSP